MASQTVFLQDSFVVPSPNSFHRNSKLKPTAKRAVWQKPPSLLLPKRPFKGEAGIPRAVTPPRGPETSKSKPSATTTPTQPARVPIQLQTPPASKKKTSSKVSPRPQKQVKVQRSDSLTRFTDPLPSPLRTPLCRFSVLEYSANAPVGRLEVKELVGEKQTEVEVTVASCQEVKHEVDNMKARGERDQDVYKLKVSRRLSRIPVWKGPKTVNSRARCPTCGARKLTTTEKTNVSQEVSFSSFASAVQWIEVLPTDDHSHAETPQPKSEPVVAFLAELQAHDFNPDENSFNPLPGQVSNISVPSEIHITDDYHVPHDETRSFFHSRNKPTHIPSTEDDTPHCSVALAIDTYTLPGPPNISPTSTSVGLSASNSIVKSYSEDTPSKKPEPAVICHPQTPVSLQAVVKSHSEDTPHWKDTSDTSTNANVALAQTTPDRLLATYSAEKSHSEDSPFRKAERVAGTVRTSTPRSLPVAGSAVKSHSEDTPLMRRENITIHTNSNAPCFAPVTLPHSPKKMPIKSRSSFLSRLFRRPSKEVLPSPALVYTPDLSFDDAISFAQFVVLDELRRFHLNRRKLRSTSRMAFIFAEPDPALEAYSVTPEAQSALAEADVLDVLFQCDESFVSETKEEVENEAFKEVAIDNAIDASVVEAHKTAAHDADGVAVVRNTQPPKSAPAVTCLKGPETFQSKGWDLKSVTQISTVALSPVSVIASPACEKENVESEMSARVLSAITNRKNIAIVKIAEPRALQEAKVLRKERVLVDANLEACEVVAEVPMAPQPALTGIQARIFALNRYSTSAPPSFMPGAHVCKLRAPAWSDRDYIDQRTQREIEMLRGMKRVEKGGEVIVNHPVFGGNGEGEEGEIGKENRRGMSLGALAVLRRYKGKVSA